MELGVRNPLLLALVVACGGAEVRTTGPAPVTLAARAPAPASDCAGAACRPACEAGEAGACVGAGDQLWAGDSEAARALWEAGCRGGSATACARRATAATGSDEAQTWDARACELGAAASCLMAGQLALRSAWAPRPNEDPRRSLANAKLLLARACDLHSFFACADLAREAARPRALLARARGAANADCDRGEAFGCVYLAQAALRAGDRDRARELALRACVHSETRPTDARVLQESCPWARVLGAGDAEVSAAFSRAGRPGPDDQPAKVKQRALEATRVAGVTQIQPGDAERDSLGADGSVTATARLCLDRNGNTRTAVLLAGPGWPTWERKLLRAMRGWRYTPFTVDGEPVPVCTSITFVYKRR